MGYKYIRVSTKEVYDLVMKIEESKGKLWRSGSLPTTIGLQTYLPMYISVGESSLSFKAGHKTLDADDVLYTLDDYFNGKIVVEETIIAGYKVTDVTLKGFNVGCKYVTWKEVDKLLELRPED